MIEAGQSGALRVRGDAATLIAGCVIRAASCETGLRVVLIQGVSPQHGPPLLVHLSRVHHEAYCCIGASVLPPSHDQVAAV